ncbi:MAG: hypothetical protein AB3N28_12045 [Kordiimonas sp.]
MTIPAANDNNQYSMFDGLVNVYDAAGNITDDGRFEYEFDAVRVADGSTYWSAPSKPAAESLQEGWHHTDAGG